MCFRQRFVGGEQADTSSGSAWPSRDHDAFEHKPVVNVAVRKRTQDNLRTQFLDRPGDFPIYEADRLWVGHAFWDLKEPQFLNAQNFEGLLIPPAPSLVACPIVKLEGVVGW